MGNANCWIISSTNDKPPSVFVERQNEQARHQFHMLIADALDHASEATQIILQWADAFGKLESIAVVTVERKL